MEKWGGKTAIVTGASAGIGEAIACDLVKYGINVVALARRFEKLETLKDELKDEKGKIIPIKCDITDKSSIDAAFEEIEKQVGDIQILVNNAGGGGLSTILNDKESTDDIITKTINLNFLGLVRASRKAYMLMKKTDDYGIIINIGSVEGHNVSCSFPVNVYPATKFAVRAVTETMRQELIKLNDPKIRVCEISPGAVETEAISKLKDRMQTQRGIDIGTFKMLKSPDIAQTVRFILMTPYDVNITEMIVRPVGENV